jgi:hypothetical protein
MKSLRFHFLISWTEDNTETKFSLFACPKLICNKDYVETCGEHLKLSLHNARVEVYTSSAFMLFLSGVPAREKGKGGERGREKQIEKKREASCCVQFSDIIALGHRS